MRGKLFGCRLEGARAILVERFSEDATLIGTLREEVWSRGRLCSRVRAGKAEAGAKFADYFEFSEPSGSDARSPGRSTSKENRRPRRRRSGCRFAADSPLEGTGFEPSVPPRKRHPSKEASAADHGRLARRPVLNDANQLIGPASLVGNSRETFTRAGPMVRIQFPPPVSLSQPGPADAVGQSRGCGAGPRR